MLGSTVERLWLVVWLWDCKDEQLWLFVPIGKGLIWRTNLGWLKKGLKKIYFKSGIFQPRSDPPQVFFFITISVQRPAVEDIKKCRLGFDWIGLVKEYPCPVRLSVLFWIFHQNHRMHSSENIAKKCSVVYTAPALFRSSRLQGLPNDVLYPN